MKTPSALLLLADGTEEMEAVITSDILSRAGFSVTRAAVAVPERIVQCANGMTVQADVKLEDVKDAGQGFDVLVLPGGAKGSKTFSHVREEDSFEFTSHIYVLAYLLACLLV